VVTAAEADHLSSTHNFFQVIPFLAADVFLARRNLVIQEAILGIGVGMAAFFGGQADIAPDFNRRRGVGGGQDDFVHEKVTPDGVAGPSRRAHQQGHTKCQETRDPNHRSSSNNRCKKG
jgi:hypothetical protein